MSSGIYAYSQDTINMVKILNIEQDIVALENRITSSIKVNNPDIANIQGLRQYHILWLNSYTDKKEDYLDHSFLYKLFFGYYELSPKVKKIKGCKPSLLYRINPDLYYYINSKRWKKFIRTTTLITDSTGNLVARGDARFVVGYTKFSQSDKELAKMFFEKEIDFAFCMGGQFGTYIGIKDDNLFALEETKEGLKIYSWEEFMKCCFDKWVYLRK
jgi:hypothetical protein